MQEWRVLRSSLAGFRQRYRRLLWVAGAAAVLAGGLWYGLFFCLLDLLLRFSPWARGTAWVLLVGGLLAGIAGAARGALRPLSLAALATRLERLRPEFANRLINTVQFGESPAAPHREFAGQLLAEAPVSLSGCTPAALFPGNFWRGLGWGLLGALLLHGLLAGLTPRGYAASIQRLLLPWADIAPFSFTRILQVTPGNTTVARGLGLPVEVRFAGRRTPTATLHAKGPAGTRSLDMQPLPDRPGTFTGALPPLLESTEYWITGGDAKSPRYRAEAAAPPALASWHAQVLPPAYTRLASFDLGTGLPAADVPEGATLKLEGQAAQPLASVAARQDGRELARVELAGRPGFALEIPLAGATPPTLALRAANGLDGEAALPLTIRRDLPPSIAFAGEARRLELPPDAVATLEFRATDDYGLTEVFLEWLETKDKTQVIATLKAGSPPRTEVTGRFLQELSHFGLKPGGVLRLRLGARDNGPAATQRVGYSNVLEIVVPLPQQLAEDKQEKRKGQDLSLTRLISLQQDNLKAGEKAQDALKGGELALPERQRLSSTQLEIGNLADALLRNPALLGDVGVRLAALRQAEMRQAEQALDTLCRLPAGEQPPQLASALDLERKILATLRGLPPALGAENKYQDRSDLLSQLQNLVRRQGNLLNRSRQGQKDGLQGDPVATLAVEQEDLAERLAQFQEAARKQTAAGSDDADEFGRKLGEALKVIEEAATGDKMLIAAAQLRKLDWPGAVQAEDESLKALLRALDVMNRWRVERAQKTIAEAAKTLKDVADKLDGMAKKQNEIVEVAKDLNKRTASEQELKEALAKKVKEQEKFEKLLEDMARDLYQFPELPVCNELNTKMREIWEDVEQVKGSEKAPAVEIAVQKEEGLLDAIKKAKERVEDVEMWLPNVPDNIKWNLESFDAKEFPPMPLVPLPETLDDIVGDLLDQAASAEAESQDSTGNQMMADAQMGWGIMDGPMPNFSAKGKSGNAKPNDNEMTGRSGAGREGQSEGELVENTVKGLQGRETHARKTNDPMQSGQVQEAEDSTLDAKATGGGKLGGESERQGMFGQAPRRDLNAKTGADPRGLRQETEALYATARMLYLGRTDALAAAADNLRKVERVDRQSPDFAGLNQRVLKQLRDSHTELTTGAVLPIVSAANVRQDGGTEAGDLDLKQIGVDYRDAVADYYKSLGQ